MKYDAAIAYLTAHPEEIHDAWYHPLTHVAGCLFQWCCKNVCNAPERIGCLSMVYAMDKYVAETPDLTATIRSDDRIQGDSEKIGVVDLPVFAEWQRRIDKELCR